MEEEQSSSISKPSSNIIDKSEYIICENCEEKHDPSH